MKKIIITTIFFLFIFLLHTSTSYAATYYVSNTGLDTNNGISESTPWQTISKVNATTFSPGDSILFKRGDTFYGSITVSQSGTAGNPITFSSYGSGSQPIITGFTDVTEWTNLGNNIWESTSPVSTLSTLNMVTINNVNTPMGRWPNADNTASKGYLTYQTSSPTSITSSSLSENPDWDGAEVVVRSSNFSIERRMITSHLGSTLNWTSATIRGPSNGFGFFIQNDLRTLDQQNEWYYNPSTKKISIYSTSQPTNVKIASIDKLISVNKNYITIDGVNLIGANTYGINDTDTSVKVYVTVQNCNMSFVGTSGISLRGTNVLYENNTVTDSNGSGIGTSSSSSDVTIRGNTVTNIAVNPGQAYVTATPGYVTNAIGSGNYTNNVIIENNSLINVGFNGITFHGNNILVKNNFVDTFCQIMDDGGGIYTYTGPNQVAMNNVVIDSNIIINGIGAPQGTNLSVVTVAAGIYLDNKSKNVEVLNNTVANGILYGFFANESSFINFHDNKVYNAHHPTYGYVAQFRINYPSSAVDFYANFNMNNNIFLSKSASQLVGNINSSGNNIPLIGTLNNNYYARPIDDNIIFNISQPNTGGSYNKTLAQWQTFSGQDANSKKSPISITSESDIFFDYNATQSSKTVSLPWPVVDMDGNKVTGNVTILPYRSVIYLKDPSPNTVDSLPPSISSFTIPTTSTSLAISITTLSATDSTGVTGYLLNETGSTPSAGSGPWSSTPPTSYTFTTQGTKTLYAFAKDLAGNVSLSSSDTITITLPVVTPPAGGGGGGGASSTTTITCPTGTTLVNTTCVTNTTTSATLIDKAKQKDIKPDGSINIIDFNIIMANWNKTYTKDISLTKGDITGDGLINIFDMNQLMVMWGVRY